MFRTIQQEVTFRATPRQVYDALMTTQSHRGFTGAEAHIGTNVGDTFSAYDGYITGRNLQLEPGSRIVQEWRGEEDDWPEGHASRVTFELTPTETGTQLTFTHEDVPEAVAESIAAGWHEYYWDPMRRTFGW